MGINLDKPYLWKADISQSVDFYNKWFMSFAPKTYRESRGMTASRVEDAIKQTRQLVEITPETLRKHPEFLAILRMCTCPPLARDRLIGLSGVSKNLVMVMENSENPRIPSKLDEKELVAELQKICKIINEMIDQDIFDWLLKKRDPSLTELNRASAIIADRLCGSYSDPLIRNEQEKRQLGAISNFLEKRGYSLVDTNESINEMKEKTFSFHKNVPAFISGQDGKKINITVDVAVKRPETSHNQFPLLIECKSAGDFTNVNKRRKEEAEKMHQLKNTYGQNVPYVLFLCGYFDAGYLGYEAAEGIDWIWEHRISDLDMLDL